MGDRVTIRLENRQIQAAGRMEEAGEADNQSEAIRQFINSGMAEEGYGNGEPPTDTKLQKLTRESARALAYVGIAWLVVAWMFPVEFRIPAAGVLFSAVALAGFERVLEEYEPSVSRRLQGVIARGGKT